MKSIDAKAVDGSNVRFWLKQVWTDSVNYSAIQFGLFDEPGASAFPNSHFTEFVERRVASAKAKGATHALLVLMTEGTIANYVALEVDDVAEAWRRSRRPQTKLFAFAMPHLLMRLVQFTPATPGPSLAVIPLAHMDWPQDGLDLESSFRCKAR